MSIYVIDDHPLMRDAIVMVLRRLRPAENIVELDRLDKLASSVQQKGAPTAPVPSTPPSAPVPTTPPQP